MSSPSREQRNPCKGTPERAWVRVRLAALDGTTQEFELVADTGSPYEVIIGTLTMQQFEIRPMGM